MARAMHRTPSVALVVFLAFFVASPARALADPDPSAPSAPAASADPAALPPPPAEPPPPPPAPPAPPPPPPPPSDDVTIVRAPPAAPCALPRGAYTHDRFYFRFSQGYGYASVSGHGTTGQANVSGAATSGALLLGGTPWQGLVIGGGFRFSTVNGSLAGGQYDGYDVTGLSLLVGPFVDWFPDAHDGWHIGAMVGLDVVGISNTAISASTGGFGATLFGGYDFWIGPQWSLGLLAAASAGTSGELHDGGDNDTGYAVTPFSFLLEWSLLLH